MRHHNSLFHQLLQVVPWDRFGEIVAYHGADRRVRRLTTKSQLVALMYGQLSGAQSLREIEQGLGSHAPRLYHLGVTQPARSTLADANAKRPAKVFADLFAVMTMSAGRGLRRHMREAVHLVDATSIRLTDVSLAWADYEAHGALVKVHVDFDAGCAIPANIAITPARINDIVMAHTLPVEPGATYVFDLGYYDFSWWSRLDEAGCRIVTRLKTNTRPRVVEKRCVPADAPITSDQIVTIDQRLKGNRRNPLADVSLREITVTIDKGRTLRLLTNDLDATAESIAALYKARWQVELFFRWVKQHLKIKHFLGTSENAIRAQIAVALIVFVMLRLAAEASRATSSLLSFVRLVRANLMHLRPLQDLDQPPPRRISDIRQQELDLC
ncbi:MAG: IS4 family transposase [Hyphomicrobiaceae bacterium]|jgi:hypothetical protein